jgi:1-acyl-sn-glycerol-3-phosphate acyltransferase
MKHASFLRTAASWLAGKGIVGFASLLTGVQARWTVGPQATPTLYFANHASHADFVLVWASLPSDLRSLTRPVAGQDYWMASAVRRFVGKDVVHALMIKRDAATPGDDPVQAMVDALHGGDSLIMFPEGTRNVTDDIMLPLKSGLFHVVRQCPQARFVPVWIENLKRVLPKGVLIPVPLACTVSFGEPLTLQEGEDKTDFLLRAREAMLALRPDSEGQA